jgi:malonyl-CoA/methylmalonyl-CoA synthetase
MTHLIERAALHADRMAFRGGTERQRYADLLDRSAAVAGTLLSGSANLAEERVAFLAPAGMPYTELLWGIWRAGGIAVPLSASATGAEIEHQLRIAGVRRVLVPGNPPEAVGQAAAAAGAHCVTMRASKSAAAAALPAVAPDRRALLIFTSGTTGRPKGAVWTHAMLDAQIEALVDSWEWRDADAIPLFLPLHHVHGILNVLCCALWSGALLEPFDRFDATAILARVRDRAYSVFMAVPTVYVKLIETLEGMTPADRDACREGFAAMRLTVSGSAALPVRVHREWHALTGQMLLERYGMTEIGMAISNPLRGERRPGSVGVPLPAVEIQLVDESGARIESEDEPGEIWARGPGVFRGYWNDKEATAEAFTRGWFRTGDVAVRERGYFRIMGRRSVDIIKSGGYKLSALEIEQTLLSHPAVAECAVIGLPDPTWGEVVCAAIVPRDGRSFDVAELQRWCGAQLSDYKQPRRFVLMPALPRNVMGKVLKTDLAALVGTGAGRALPQEEKGT